MQVWVVWVVWVGVGVLLPARTPSDHTEGGGLKKTLFEVLVGAQ